MSDVVTREVRNFIKLYGRYRFYKLHEMLKENLSDEKISHTLGLEQNSIRSWRNIFLIIGEEDLPRPQFQETVNEVIHLTPPKFEVLVNEDPIVQKKPRLRKIHLRLY
ncbi:MAG: hypothetical protein VX278_08775 [Myxococcota bacterium]|nr:hypothetical protein [Myxococcota bacterium]